VFVEGRGWVWIPGRAYRGAWVAWSVDDGYSYVGWAPLPPPFVWFGGVAVVWRGPYVGPRWVYCPHGEVFSPSVGARIVAGPSVVAVAARMRIYATGTAAVTAGPVPARLGFTPVQVPHATGAGAASVARATQFARPSTAQPLGARPPARIAPAVRAAAPAPARPVEVASAPSGMGRAAPSVSRSAEPAIVPHVGVPHAAPAFRSGGHFGGGHFGGGHHR
jgi:hypothetical protein